ncbi:polysaccharide biosynthesis protein [Flavobacterium urocaniciphilum]|uniref:NDP-sugar epimerase, includes UDP-GlcNAc-inverting 4,6-dehydratase FlaA1 and capsular polysaccharide biosynthesis protein EpsC n=1 Tax=Flavobacterium urocaniciphilum TaxID=1299341 RepID=A0A1H8YS23_9FLAO|nr:nucleoside-diphosphate sugar epimerase/dehydratase [Flavobacterium urocaniciphilum]SEP54801.1 NDP-sugar epimerase, includes UDP-GlcNAc-inverting 4,6-dehydratase FlaA1 and capsular polysaccharide biosynthesis protein EpsC [Flavobacterium urocaniciphilum]
MNSNKTSYKSIFSDLFSKDKILHFGYLPRWIIFSIDIAIVIIANIVTYFLISQLTFKYYNTLDLTGRALIILATQIFFFFAFKTYAGIIRHSTLNDGYNLFKATFSSFLALTVLNYVHFYKAGAKIFLMPALFLTFLFSFIFLLFFRIVVKVVYQIYLDASNQNNLENIVIYGTDSNAISLANAINAEYPKRYKLVGFIDKYNKNTTKTILNVPIISHDKSIEKILDSLDAKNLIIADKNIPSKLQLLIVDQCLQHNIKLLKVPVVMDWNTKKISNSLKTFEILDLLDRKQIVLDNSKISQQITNKVVLITGAAGSIGSEIVRQVLNFSPSKIILIDQAETPLHQLTLELSKVTIEIVPIIADVRDKEQLERIFKSLNPHFVFHAAAYKHVPLMETNPNQAIFTNVVGTKNLADLAVKFKVERFVFISTDKAVNPSNVMGASKRIAEKYVQSLSIYLDQMGESSTKFITTRFGNVLGSNGSVVPLFTKQINEGGPITITHPDIIRYFMTIPEACQLVLEAGAMGNGSEIFIFDMGKPVKIIDLAHKMIKLAGYVPEEDIKIEVVGLRPGEKLYEELLTDASTTLPTHHQKIMIAKDITENYISLNEDVLELINWANENNIDTLVKKMKQIVPEFVSLNSKFEKFDN